MAVMVHLYQPFPPAVIVAVMPASDDTTAPVEILKILPMEVVNAAELNCTRACVLSPALKKIDTVYTVPDTNPAKV